MAAIDVTFKLATTDDAINIAVMSRDLIETGLGWSWTRARVAKNIQSRDTLTVLAWDGDRLAGFAMMHFGDEQAHLNLFAVRPEYQRTGIGRRFIKWLEESALTAGIATIHLEVRATNHAARRFYRAQGFQELAFLPFYYRGREAAVRMLRQIGKPAPPADPNPPLAS
jgi:[ribosomal protein S18]-alanine N-acetyltransferase